MDQRPDIAEQYRPTNGVADAGVYRVVGTTEEMVTLLRVGDEDGTRVHTGELESVPQETFSEAFTRASELDSPSRLPRALAGVAVGLIVVAALSWTGVFMTPASPGTLAALGVLSYIAGRIIDRVDLPAFFP